MRRSTTRPWPRFRAASSPATATTDSAASASRSSCKIEERPRVGGAADPASPELLEFGRVVEQLRQANAAVAALREGRVVAIARIEVRRRVIRREQHQLVEELQHLVLLRLREAREGVARSLRFATVSQDDFAQVDAASIVAIRRR